MDFGIQVGNSISQKVFRNTFCNIIGRIWSIVVTLLLTPYIIKHIGVERFGVWALVGVITGYFGLLDFGFNLSFIKYIAEFYAKKEYYKINEVINNGFIFYFIFTILIFVILLFILNPILRIFKIPPFLINETFLVVLIGIAIFGLSNALSPFLAVQIGLQRMDINNIIAIAVSIPNILGTVYFLEKGYGLIGLMVNNFIIFVILNIANFVVARKLLPGLVFNPFAFSGSMFKRLFKFGSRVQITKFSGVVASQTDKLLIAYFISIAVVTFYQLGANVVSFAVSIVSLLTSALMPAFSEIEASGKREKLIESYTHCTKYLTFFTAPLFVFIIISAAEIMNVWMGAYYERSSLIIQILSAAFLINTIAQVAVAVCYAIDKPQIMVKGSLITIFSNVFLSIILVKIFGFLGAAWGTLLAVNLGTIYFLRELHRDLEVSFKKLVEISLPYLVICIFAAVIIFVIDLSMSSFHFVNNRATAFAILFARAMIFSIIYFFGVRFNKLFNVDDIKFIQKHIPLASKWLKYLG